MAFFSEAGMLSIEKVARHVTTAASIEETEIGTESVLSRSLTLLYYDSESQR